MFRQMSENIFFEKKCGFRRGCSTQHCFLATLKKWETSVNKAKILGALLTELPKAFDCLD